MSTIDNNPPALVTPLATTKEPADQWASHTIEALSRDDSAPPSKEEAAFQSHSTATTPGPHIPGAFPTQSSQLTTTHNTAEGLRSDAEYVKDAAMNALHTAREYVGSARETVGGYLPPSVAAYFPGGHTEQTARNPGSHEPTHHIRDVAHAIVPPSTSEEFGIVPDPAAVHNSQSSPAQYLHPHSTLAANPPIGSLIGEGSTRDASTKSLPGSRVGTPCSFSDIPPGLACSNGCGDHHDAHSQPAEDRTHQPSGLATAIVLPEAPPLVSLNQPLIVTPSERELAQERSTLAGPPLAENHQRSLDAEQERGTGVVEENVPMHVFVGKTETGGKEQPNVVSEEERVDFGSAREKEKGKEQPIITPPTTESESVKATKERTLREELAALQVTEQEGPSAVPSSSLQPATMTRIRTTLEPGEKDRPPKPPTEVELKAQSHAETMPLRTPEKKEHRKSFMDKLKEKIHVGGREKKAASTAQQHQQEGTAEVLQPQSKN